MHLLLEHTHDARFVSLMDTQLPSWHQLNRLPVSHGHWAVEATPAEPR